MGSAVVYRLLHVSLLWKERTERGKWWCTRAHRSKIGDGVLSRAKISRDEMPRGAKFTVFIGIYRRARNFAARIFVGGAELPEVKQCGDGGFFERQKKKKTGSRKAEVSRSLTSRIMSRYPQSRVEMLPERGGDTRAFFLARSPVTRRATVVRYRIVLPPCRAAIIHLFSVSYHLPNCRARDNPPRDEETKIR